MLPALSTSDLALLIREADHAARRLRLLLRLPANDQDDLRQDLVLELLEALPNFDANRGSLGAFLGTVARNKANRIARRAQARRRISGGSFVSLDDAGFSDASPRLRGACRQAITSRGWNSGGADEMLALMRPSFERVFSALSPEQRSFCLAAAEHSLSELVALGFGSRSAAHRRLQDLRCELTARGLGAAWDDFAGQ